MLSFIFLRLAVFPPHDSRALSSPALRVLGFARDALGRGVVSSSEVPPPPLPATFLRFQAFGGKYKTQFDSALYLGSPMDQDFRAVVAESSTSQAVAATLTS